MLSPAHEWERFMSSLAMPALQILFFSLTLAATNGKLKGWKICYAFITHCSGRKAVNSSRGGRRTDIQFHARTIFCQLQDGWGALFSNGERLLKEQSCINSFQIFSEEQKGNWFISTYLNGESQTLDYYVLMFWRLTQCLLMNGKVISWLH